MHGKTRILLVAAVACVIALGLLGLMPTIVSTGLRYWIWHSAKKCSFAVEIGVIEAPFLRHVVLHDVRIASPPNAACHMEFRTARAELDLNLSGFFSHRRGRVLRLLRTEAPRLEITRAAGVANHPQPAADWSPLQDFLPDEWSIQHLSGRIQQGVALVDFRDVSISASQLEAGVFAAHAITVVSPLFRTSFNDLRGATSWLDDRLTIGAITLTHGLDIQAFTLDLSNLSELRVGLGLDLDAFGGNVRADVASDAKGNDRVWNLAGSASNISIARLSEALGLTETAAGSIRVSKFTFRGSFEDLTTATASVWIELTELTWRERSAQYITFGASLYNRELEIEQLYIKQHANELTLTGGVAMPEMLSNWRKPDFHGDVSASVRDLREFTKLFGADPQNFEGEMFLNGTVATENQSLSGKLSASGRALKLFGMPIETADADLALTGSQLRFQRIELRRGRDFVRGNVRVGLTNSHAYSGELAGELQNMGDYRASLPAWIQLTNGALKFNWTGDGARHESYGTVRVDGHSLRWDTRLAAPVFDLQVDAVYSPESVFFRELHLANADASFDAYATIAKNYLQLQAIRFALAGQPKIEGTFFIPFSFSHFVENRNVSQALASDSSVDADLRISPIDLGELSRAFGGRVALDGKIDGQVAAFGTLVAPDVNIEAHVHDFKSDDGNIVSGDANLSTHDQGLHLQASIRPAGSAPVEFEAGVPFQSAADPLRYSIEMDKPIAARVDTAGLVLEKLPLFSRLSSRFGGAMASKISVGGTARHPVIDGKLQMKDLGRVDKTVSANIDFAGRDARVDPAIFRMENRTATFRGAVNFDDLGSISVKLTPQNGIGMAASADPLPCIAAVRLISPSVSSTAKQWEISEGELRGGIPNGSWTFTLTERETGPGKERQPANEMPTHTQTFELCGGDSNNAGSLDLQIGAPAQR
ncbi:MAG TPA: hypothetical protein VGQ82_09520 [Chthoniobacterales bacterium]|nr:hypothetical protein [Chthoniobacterales bacterium]